MAITPPPSVAPAPTPAPQRGDRTTFSPRVDAFVTWLTTSVAEFGALAANVWANATSAFDSATAAAADRTLAEAAAAAAALTSGASIWISDTIYVIGDNRFSPINFQTYRRKTAGAGAIDPSLDSTNWAAVGASGLTIVHVVGTTQAVTAGNQYVFENVAASTATMDAAPAEGDTVSFVIENGLLTNLINFNGKDHENVTWATDPTCTLGSLATSTWRFINNKWRL